MGNDRLSGKQVGSQTSGRVTRRLAWIQPVCISINAVPALKGLNLRVFTRWKDVTSKVFEDLLFKFLINIKVLIKLALLVGLGCGQCFYFFILPNISSNLID